MIIAVSIVDKHKPQGRGHIGTYMFEIDYPSDSHFDFKTVACEPGGEASMRPHLNRLLEKEEILRMDREFRREGDT